jgi:glycosyltransferase involved in cell wall biosynthesis
MKILYIGPYRQGDGWGNASKQFVKALFETGHDIAIRPVYMSGNIDGDEVDRLFSQLESNRFDSYDVSIQQVLPTMFEYNHKIKKNIGMFFSETQNLQFTPWVKHCNLMDEIWVSSEQERISLVGSYVNVPIKKVNIPVDVDRFKKKYTKLPLPITGKPFIFYFIGEHVNRKNLTALVLAFHLEFGLSEQVELLIKANKSGISANNLHKAIDAELQQVKQSFGIYRTIQDYKKELIFTEHLSDEDMCRLHNSCDCFVMPSHGEAWCIPAMDAAGFGKQPIVSGNTGMTEFINKNTGWVVPTSNFPVLGIDRPIDYLYRGREEWVNVHIPLLRQAMREAFNGVKKQSINVEEYSYKAIAEQINESLT